MKKTILTIIASIFLMVNFALAEHPADLDLNFGLDGVLEENGYDSIMDAEINSSNEIVYATRRGIKVFEQDGQTLLSSIPNIVYQYQNNPVEIRNVAVLADKTILVAGFVYNNGSQATCLVKLQSNLQIDTAFGQNGFVIIDNTTFRYICGSGNSLVVQPDNKILIIGGRYDKTTPNSQYEQFLIRLESNGANDFSFGNGGIVTESINHAYTFGSNLTFQSKNIVVSGMFQLGCYLVVYDKNGKRQTRFNNGDIMLNVSLSVVVQSDKKIVYSDNFVTVGGYVGLKRLNADGTPDSTYSTTFINLNNSIATRNNNLIIDNNDRVYVSVWTYLNNYLDERPSIGLFKPGGKLESNFVSSESQPFPSGLNLVFYTPSNNMLPFKIICQGSKILMVTSDVVNQKSLIFRINGI